MTGEQRNRLAELVEQARSDDYHGWYIAEKLAELSGAEIAPVDACFIAACSPDVIRALLAEAGHAATLREALHDLITLCEPEEHALIWADTGCTWGSPAAPCRWCAARSALAAAAEGRNER